MNFSILKQDIISKINLLQEDEIFQDAQKSLLEEKKWDYIIYLRASWNEEDRDWDYIVQEWIDWTHFDKNPVIFLDHTYSISSIAWACIWRELRSDGTYLKVKLASWVAAWDLAIALHKQWMLRGASIWFMNAVREQGNPKKIIKCEALETSLVWVWSYRDALIDYQPLMKKCIEAGIIKEISEEEIKTDAPENEINSELKTIKSELNEIKTLLKTLTDDKVEKKTEENIIDKKETLQIIDKAIGVALQNIKLLK